LIFAEMDMVERILREATAKSKDGRVSQSDFLNYSQANSRYSLFTPMEASIIFHFASRGSGEQRLALIDFAQLLDPRWRAPHDESDDSTVDAIKASPTSWGNALLGSAYNFVQGGWAIYPYPLLFTIF
jgi:solute carrier family 25 (mitochondrial aspartate/glutamate transporter), member 12/13